MVKISKVDEEEDKVSREGEDDCAGEHAEGDPEEFKTVLFGVLGGAGVAIIGLGAGLV